MKTKLPEDFCAFILTHGRPENVITYKTLKCLGYTGKIYLVVDDEDSSLPLYREKYGEQVLVFSKDEVAKGFDLADTFHEKKGAVIFARNACFELAKRVGCNHFIQLDDDYTDFVIRVMSQGKLLARYASLDQIFAAVFHYYRSIPALSVALAQGGDFIGGVNSQMFRNGYRMKRKAMNSFFCSLDRPFQFVGRINEDVNTYTTLGSRGALFLTIPHFQLSQKQTQANAGGMTGTYLENGTYFKSFYSVMMQPSSVKIALMGDHHKRIHHRVYWDKCVPKIINQKYKK